VSVRWTLEVADVDVATEIPAVTERRADWHPVLDVWVAIVSLLHYRNTRAHTRTHASDTV